MSKLWNPFCPKMDMNMPVGHHAVDLCVIHSVWDWMGFTDLMSNLQVLDPVVASPTVKSSLTSSLKNVSQHVEGYQLDLKCSSRCICPLNCRVLTCLIVGIWFGLWPSFSRLTATARTNSTHLLRPVRRLEMSTAHISLHSWLSLLSQSPISLIVEIVGY